MSSQSLTFRSVGRTHQGVVRALNEDTFIERTELGLWVVADGMGGHQKGDVAAERIAEVFGRLDAGLKGVKLEDAVRSLIELENMKLYSMGAAIAPDQTMGATIATLIVDRDRYLCQWVGDSRILLIRGDHIRQLTTDHSLVQEMVESGDLTQEDADNHPMRNVITRAVGADRQIDIDRVEGEVLPGDFLLLATDGVTNVCSAEEIADAITGQSMEDAAKYLVDTCLDRGAPDNLSFIIVQVAA